MDNLVDTIIVYVGGETLARLRRISKIDGRSPEDLALCAIEEEARMDMRGDFQAESHPKQRRR